MTAATPVRAAAHGRRCKGEALRASRFELIPEPPTSDSPAVVSGVPRPEPVSRFNRFRSERSSEAVWQRSSRSFSSALLIISSSLGGTSQFRRTADTGERSRIALKMRPDVSPRKGTLPVHISYSTAPKENRSVRASSSFPLTCSGDMYATVPIVVPGLVRSCSVMSIVGLETDPADCGFAPSFARPKSRLHRFSCYHVLERAPLQQFHGDESLAINFVDLVDRADTRMIQGGGSARLTAESFDCLWVFGQFFGKKFQCDVAAELKVFRLVDHPHTTTTDFTNDVVMGKRLSHGLEGRGHCGGW